MMKFVGAVLLVMAIWWLATFLRGRGAADQTGFAAAEREAELQREIAELRERVKVLERIVVESGEAARLSAEIDRLRDDRADG